jgi:hypothetical protein
MTVHHDRLGIAPTATPAEVKAAYHAKLREFPAHTHPDDFKAIRTAYEAIRTGAASQTEDFFKIRPLEVTLDPEPLNHLREQIMTHLTVSLDDLIRATF